MNVHSLHERYGKLLETLEAREGDLQFNAVALEAERIVATGEDDVSEFEDRGMLRAVKYLEEYLGVEYPNYMQEAKELT